MAWLGLLFAVAALTVKQDGAELREGCEPGDRVVESLPAGSPATVRFGMNGCYAVDVIYAGKVRKGFLRASQLEGIEAWDQERRKAPDTSWVPGTQEKSSRVDRSPWELIQDNRPGEALAAAERLILSSPRDPQLLALAGLAAYRNDMGVRAIGLWKDSLALRSDPAVSRLLDQALREQQSDRTGEPLHSARFVLRYDAAIMSRETARSLLELLERESSRITFDLGCSTVERVAVIAQTREDFRRATGAAEWSGGQFDGRIRVALLEGDAGGASTRRALAHELVHACLAATGRWPAWLHEGLAQKLSGDALDDSSRAAVRAAAKAGNLPRLTNLSQSWSRMSAAHAALAYAASLHAVEQFYEYHANYGIRNLLKNPDKLEQITLDLDRRLRE